MTELELAEIEKRANAATPGPWVDVVQSWDGTNYTGIEAPAAEHAIVATEPVQFFAYASGAFIEPQGIDANMEFIAHAREDVPKLVTRVRELQAENVRLGKEINSNMAALSHVSQQRRSLQ